MSAPTIQLMTFDRLLGGKVFLNPAMIASVYPTKFLSDPGRQDLIGRDCLEILIQGQCFVITDTDAHRKLLGLPSRKLRNKRTRVPGDL